MYYNMAGNVPEYMEVLKHKLPYLTNVAEGSWVLYLGLSLSQFLSYILLVAHDGHESLQHLLRLQSFALHGKGIIICSRVVT